MAGKEEEIGQWLELEIVRRSGAQGQSFETVAEHPIYEVVDSLDLVELLAGLEERFGLLIEPGALSWTPQPTARQLVDRLKAHGS